MTMGVIRGAFFGLVLGGAGVSVASVVGPQPAGNAPPTSPPLVDAPQTAAVSAPQTDAPTAAIANDASPRVATPQVTAPQPQTPAIEGDTDPLAPPATAEVAQVPDTPEVNAEPLVAAEAETPVLPTPQSLAPQVPTNEENLVVDTAPAAPVVVDDTSAADVAVETPPVVAADQTADPVDSDAIETALADNADIAQADEPAQEVAPAAVQNVTEATTAETAATATPEAAVSDAAQTLAQPAPELVLPVAPAAETQSAATDETAPVVTAPQAEAPVAAQTADTPVTAQDTPGVVVADTAPAQASNDVIAGAEVVDDNTVPTNEEDDAAVVVSLIDGSSSAMPEGDSGVRINRVGATDEAAAEPAEEVAAPAETTGVALVDYAAEFENPDGKPLVSLILLDEGRIQAGPALLSQLPFAVTVMVDAGQPGAAEKMAGYRAAGIEVGAALRLPTGATASDVEIALEAARSSLGEAVIVTDLGTAERASREQMILALAGEGRGYLSLSAGLGNGLREAEAAGVPAVAVFRDLDSEDQDARVIRRFLDQAAFRARQDSGVVLLGRVRPDTLSALTLWGTANRAGQVVMAPVSAVLTAEDDS